MLINFVAREQKLIKFDFCPSCGQKIKTNKILVREIFELSRVIPRKSEYFWTVDTPLCNGFSCLTFSLDYYVQNYQSRKIHYENWKFLINKIFTNFRKIIHCIVREKHKNA